MNKFKITKEQHDKLYKAIVLAQNPGKCRYLNDDGSACCVIAQLCAAEGVDLSLLKPVDGKRIGTILNEKDEGRSGKYTEWTGANTVAAKKVAETPINNYPIELLSMLQKSWDFAFGLLSQVEARRQDLFEILAANTEVI